MVEQLLLELPTEPVEASPTIDLKVFKKALQLACKGLVARSETPWLQLVADGSKLHFISASVKVSVACFAEPFQATVVPKDLQAIVKQFNKKTKQIQLSQAGITEETDYTWPVTEVAAESLIFDEQLAPVNPAQLLAALVFLDNFASAKSHHPGFRFENNQVYFLDSREEGVLRCCFVTNYGLSVDIFPAFTTPLAILSAAKEMLKLKEIEASISPTGLQVVNETYNIQLRFNCLEDLKYPQQVLERISVPKNDLVLSREDTLAVIALLEPDYDEKQNLLRLSVTQNGEVKLEVGDNKQPLTASVTTELSCSSYLPFNLKYLKDFLEAITSELYIWKFGSATEPLVLQPIEGLNYMYSFYPLRVVEYA